MHFAHARRHISLNAAHIHVFTLNTERMSDSNSAEVDQTAQRKNIDQNIHCFPFSQQLSDTRSRSRTELFKFLKKTSD